MNKISDECFWKSELAAIKEVEGLTLEGAMTLGEPVALEPKSRDRVTIVTWTDESGNVISREIQREKTIDDPRRAKPL